MGNQFAEGLVSAILGLYFLYSSAKAVLTGEIHGMSTVAGPSSIAQWQENPIEFTFALAIQIIAGSLFMRNAIKVILK